MSNGSLSNSLQIAGTSLRTPTAGVQDSWTCRRAWPRWEAQAPFFYLKYGSECRRLGPLKNRTLTLHCSLLMMSIGGGGSSAPKTVA